MSLRRKTVVTVISKIGDRKPKADACLVVIYGQNIGHKHLLKSGEVVIGRSSQAQIQIDHESVSRRHAQLVSTEHGVVLTDMGSTNGTYVNDEAITERHLINGDLLKIGRTILKYLSSDNIEAAYYEEIYRLTTIDGLTRCFTARYAREQLVREASRAARYRRPLSVLVFDIDDFAGINEEFGHLAGDAVLAQLGRRVSRRVRREDVFARTGGGEFALVVPEVDKAGATILGQRLLRMIEETTFGFDDVKIPVTLSIGVADIGEVDAQVLTDRRDLLVDMDEHSTTETRVGRGGPLDTDARTQPPSRAEALGLSSEAGARLRTDPPEFDVSAPDVQRQGDPSDTHQLVCDALLELARSRMARAKAAGRGRFAS